MDEIETKLAYPFNSDWILENKRKIRRELLARDKQFTEKKIAVLGGSTTHDIVEILEIFLLNEEIKPVFYESEYNKYWEDAVFGNPELDNFAPDIIWIHTTSRNILKYPDLNSSEEDISESLQQEYQRYLQMWEALISRFNCPIIQNNFEQPFYRLLGNQDVSDSHGRLNYVNKLNDQFYSFASKHDDFYINDINYLASCYGLQHWADPSYWYRYKYALSLSAIPEFSYNLSLIIKSILGENKKALVLDLDNTLWGGVISEDGLKGIQIGKETAVAEMYTEFQQYLKSLKNLGVLLTIDSKNDPDIAIEGINHPENILKQADFVDIKANWNSKDQNVIQIAQDLKIGLNSLVFIDDNPAEQEIVRQNLPDVAVPEIRQQEDFIVTLDRAGFFEATRLTEDDRQRTEMYQANSQRKEQLQKYSNYEDFLVSLDMSAEIHPFSQLYMARIAQLTNKSNQFNLTTLRCTQSDLENFANDPDYITLFGRLKDKFGDNGIVSVVVGHIKEEQLHIDLWLMSCRVLQRNMEQAMMDSLIDICRKKKIQQVVGYYYPTAKNHMVKYFYQKFGYSQISEDDSGNTVWKLTVENYHNFNNVIKVNVE